MIKDWLLPGFMDAVDKIVGLFFSVIGYLFSSLAESLLSFTSWLLENTVFASISLTDTADPGVGGIVAQSFQTGWNTILLLSGGVALASLSWGLFQMHMGAAKGAPDKQTMVEGFITYAAVVIAGSTFLTTMLDVANQVTMGLLELTNANISAMFASREWFAADPSSGLGVLTGAVGVLAYFFWPTALLILGVGLLWVVLVWLYRQVDLVFFTILLPLTAAISIGGPKRAFEWNFQEAVGALFSQMTMAVAWFVAWLLITGANLTPSALPETPEMDTILPILVRLSLGIIAIFMVAKAPRMLQNISGNRHAGIGGIALGTAGGFMLAYGTRQALSMTPVGAAVSSLVGARQASVAAQVASWGDKASVGSAVSSILGRTSFGQSIQQGFAERKAAYDRKLKESYPLVFGAASSLQSAANYVRTAASFVYQPRATMGRAMRDSFARTALSQDVLETYQTGEAAQAFARQSSNEDSTMLPDEQEKYGIYRVGAQKGKAYSSYPDLVRLPGHEKPQHVQYDAMLLRRLDEFKRGRP